MNLSPLLFTLLFLLSYLFLPAQIIHVQEDFNSSSLPNGWSNTAAIGTTNWSFGINASASTTGNNNLDGTPLAYFDDDALGSSAINTAILITPSFNNSSNSLTYLEFDYNFRELAGIADTFKVEVYDGSNWITVLSRSINDCGNWISVSCAGNFPHANIDISSLASTNCQVRFVYHDGNDWGWYVGIDNVEIWSPYQYDVRVSSIAPISSSCISTDSLKVTLENLGSSPAFNFPLAYILNGSSPSSAVFTDTIAPLSFKSYTFPNPLTYSIGSNDLRVYTNLSSDQSPSNDSSYVQVAIANKFNTPYFESFENITPGWTSGGTNSSWAIGTTNGANIDTAASGSGAAVTNLYGRYSANEKSYLNSPCIYLGPSSSNIKVEFDLTYYIETVFDGSWLEYSLDGGYTWQKVNEDSLYRSFNWYNNTSKRIWEGIQGNWDHSSSVIRNLPPNTTIRFRFVLESDASTQLEGIGIDNFQVTEMKDFELSLNQIINPNDNIECGAGLEYIILELENFGRLPINTGTLSYQVNGGAIYSDTLNLTINGGSTEYFQFSQPYDFSALNNPNIQVWIDIPGDSVQTNDSQRVSITNTAISLPYNIPYLQNFDAMGSVPSEGWTSHYYPSVGGWRSARTVSSSSGPANDATGVKFWYLSTTQPFPNDSGLISPCIYLGNNKNNLVLDYSYHMYGSSMGNLFVEIFENDTWITIDSIFGQQHTSPNDPWKRRRLNLSFLTSSSFKFRFRGYKLGFLPSHMAVDDVRIRYMSGDELNIGKLYIDSTICHRSMNGWVSLDIEKDHLGVLHKDSLNFQLFQNGSLVASEFLSNDLGSHLLDTTIVLNYRPTSLPAGVNDFVLISLFTKNGIIIRDTLSVELTRTIDQLPYSYSFEDDFRTCPIYLNESPTFGQMGGWSSSEDSANSWVVSDSLYCYWGSKATHGIQSGPEAPMDGSSLIYWHSDIYNTYSYLLSPCFDLSNYNQAEVSFWYHRFIGNSPPNTNYMGNLKVDIYDGQNWQQIARIDTFWTSSNQPWLEHKIDISQYLHSNVQFRFIVDSCLYSFTSTSIDLFQITDPLSTGLESTLALAPIHSLTLYPNPNQGSFTIQLPTELIGKEYEIVDLSGKTIKRANFKGTREELNLDVEKGIYILRVPSSGITKKVVVY